ncbi:MAG: 2-C-methyl-D-erythritol 2,4-cyclodiphosphate synthase [Gemmatimonadetes bacterium]|nr:2-C-methyl-D-erythritol 2,4-cyclodiphosphate synthase [Gemmatimonadota bacterium]
MRVGTGYDSHRFAAGRRLVLGGVIIAHEFGLAGHSDAGVVAHAVTDAILGAAGAGDIGRHFPPADARWRDADSLSLLRTAAAIIAEDNYQVVNVDVTVVCESPRLATHIEAMRQALAGALGIAPRLVSVKGKSNEGMGWIGRGEGIAALAVALVHAIGE